MDADMRFLKRLEAKASANEQAMLCNLSQEQAKIILYRRNAVALLLLKMIVWF